MMIRKTQRVLALAGMAVVASATIGMSATSAFAATTDHHPGGNGNWQGGQNGNNWDHNGHNGDRRWDPRGHDTARLAGIYRSRRSCEAAGWIGEHWGQWDSYDCERHGRVYFLEVEKHRGDWHRHRH